MQQNTKQSDDKKLSEQAENNDAELRDEKLEDFGDIRIADEVICIVASLAAQEVAGVVGMSGGFTDGINRFLGKENASKGVRLKFEGKMVNASVYINVEYGYCIPEIALEVQEKVKDAIEAMTGYEVQFVDVNVEGVAKRQTTELEKEATLDEAMAEIVRAQAQRAEATEVNSFEQQLANLRDEHGFDMQLEEEMDEKHKRFFEED
ncbi:Asp23/Gls24 family envelope stress response protein [uncultured Phascolarctobacterium sp.]|uniref:Asp23/Gls24 family envelope stress response protein n=1 Tax=uncultured Phascolarctobacterium sp. TaxID=512296 RepID=UPI0026377713|nr:Asp23/Gls24 family envelope stress response protein [uncultured Phascolarctobacterium sp.]